MRSRVARNALEAPGRVGNVPEHFGGSKWASPRGNAHMGPIGCTPKGVLGASQEAESQEDYTFICVGPRKSPSFMSVAPWTPINMWGCTP